MIIFIIIVVFFIVFFYFRRSSKIKWFPGLWLIYGKKGSGKSTLLCKAAQLAYRQGRPVYSTEPFKNTILISAENYFEHKFPPGSVVIIDEIGLVHSSREFKSFPKQARSWYKLQRHGKVMVIACSQTADTDLIIRNLADKVSIVRRVTNFFNVTSYYDRRIVVARHREEGGGNAKGSEIVDDVYPANFTRRFLFTAGWRWWKFFDSWSLPDWPRIHDWVDYIPKGRVKKRQKPVKGRRKILQSKILSDLDSTLNDTME